MKKICFIIVFACNFHLGIAQITHFEAPGYDNLPISGLGNWHVLVDDLNEDGFEDLYITREAQDDLLFYGNSNGSFTSVDISGEPWNNYIGSLDIIAEDLNNDGLKELIITRIPYTGGNSEAPGAKDKILKNLGGGNFEDASSNLPTDFYNVLMPDMDAENYTTGVACGLLNSDTIPDIVMVNGGISYLPSIKLFNSFDGVVLLFPAIARDKLRNDLYYSSGTDGNGDNIDNYLNASAGSPITNYQDMSTDVVIADFNGDMEDDIFITNFHHASVFSVMGLNDSSAYCKLFLNNDLTPGDFTWNLPSFPLLKYPATSADAQDFDKDGDIDLILGMEKRSDSLAGQEYSYAMTSRVFINDGNGVFTDSTQWKFPAFKEAYTSCYDIQFVDFNDDGWLDIYGAGITSFLFIQSDTINHTFADSTHLLPISQAHPNNNITHTYHTYGAGFSDFDDNGKTDVILACTYEQLHLLFQTNSGQFIDTTTINLPPDGQNTEYAICADFTGDNLPDVIKVNNDIRTNTHAFYIQTSPVNGQPYFANKGYQIPLDTTFIKNYGVDYHDVDGDNDYDILIAGESGLKMYENDGAGNFTENTTWLTGISGLNYSTRAKFVDIDGDNDKDIFIPRAQYANTLIGHSNKIILWNGSGYIDATTTLLPSNANPSIDFDFADVNMDGWMDFSVANDNGGGALYLSNNGGMYTVSNPFTALSGSTSLKFAHLDADTFIDLVQVNKFDTNGAMIYKNSGSTPFYGNSTPIANSEEESFDVTFYDFNMDGLMDILIAGFAESNAIFVNNGAMSFQNSTPTYLPDTALRVGSFTKAIQLADLNADGLIDIYLARDNQDLLLYGQGIASLQEPNSIPDYTSITIFPNPSQEYISLDANDFNEQSELVILSSNGAIVREQKIPASGTIQIKELPEGIYFLIIHQGTKNARVARLVKTQ